MNFQNVEFEFSAGRLDQLPNSDLPEIVFSGKSNVGKSSLINKLINRKALARVSSTPGKTATINSYKLSECRLIDLPGYGYAKVSKAEKRRWADLVEGYLKSDRNIKLIIQILDIRHKPTANDIDMINYLIETDSEFVIICTKSDKLNKTQTKQQLAMFHELFDEAGVEFITFSALKGDGVDVLKTIIERAVNS